MSDILHLDVILEGSSLPTMRTMILNMKSIQFPHLRMIHSIDEQKRVICAVDQNAEIDHQGTEAREIRLPRLVVR